ALLNKRGCFAAERSDPERRSPGPVRGWRPGRSISGGHAVSDPRPYALVPSIPRHDEHGARAIECLRRSARAILACARRCAQRAAERPALAQLSDLHLRDIGITRAEADAEAAKWFWRT